MKTNYNEYSIIKFYYLTNYCGIPILISTIKIQKKVKSCKTQLEVSIKYPTQLCLILFQHNNKLSVL